MVIAAVLILVSFPLVSPIQIGNSQSNSGGASSSSSQSSSESISTMTLANSSTSSSSTSSPSTSTSVQNSPSISHYKVERENITVSGAAACVPEELEGLGCPTGSPKLGNVDLISYESSQYYATNFTSYANGQPATYDVWFSGTTIFCVSPIVDEYQPCPTFPTPTSVVSIGTDSYASSTVGSNGLRLEVQGTPAGYGSGLIAINADVFNTRNSTNDVTSADLWPIPVGLLRDTCVNQAIGFAVYQGDSVPYNATDTLSLQNPAIHDDCPSQGPQYYYQYSFAPYSIYASIIGFNGTTEQCRSGSCPISVTDSLSGYWSGAPDNSSFVEFPPGAYTLVAMDQWGQGCGIHFTVEAAPKSTTASSRSVDGLVLTASLNSTSIESGQRIAITADEQNTLDNANNVFTESNWAFWNPPNAAGHVFTPFGTNSCGVELNPMGWVVTKGYYDAGNVTTAQWLALYSYAGGLSRGCTGSYVGNNFTYLFEPSSAWADIIVYGYLPVFATNAYSGYWNSSTSTTFVNFTPGVYTVVAADEWRALVILHFKVT